MRGRTKNWNVYVTVYAGLIYIQGKRSVCTSTLPGLPAASDRAMVNFNTLRASHSSVSSHHYSGPYKGDNISKKVPYRRKIMNCLPELVGDAQPVTASFLRCFLIKWLRAARFGPKNAPYYRSILDVSPWDTTVQMEPPPVCRRSRVETPF